MRSKKTKIRLSLLCLKVFGAIAITGLSFSRPALAKMEIPTPEEIRQGGALFEMRWQDKLSADDVAAVIRGLQSDRIMIAEEAANIVALHRLKEALPTLQAIKGIDLDGRVVLKITVEALRAGRDPIEPMRDLLLKDEMPPEWQVEYTDVGGSVKEKLTLLVGIDEARSLRRGNKPNAKVKQIKLTGVAKHLVDYGSMKPEAVVDDIFERLHNTKDGSTEKRDLVSVLDSFGEKSFDLLLKKFKAVRDLNTMSGYGIDLLSLPIGRYGLGHDLSDEQAARANELIDRLETQGSPYVVTEMLLLKKAIELNAKKNKAAEAPQAATDAAAP